MANVLAPLPALAAQADRLIALGLHRAAGVTEAQVRAVAQYGPRDALLYLLHDVDRGDDLAGWSPDEALPALAQAHCSPLTLTEGIHWVLQQPEALAAICAS
ncbi:hypothetical protein KUA19_13930 [Catellatospora sp. NEAU-YM18]|nr:hypothetical protein [Catellatospora tritici]